MTGTVQELLLKVISNAVLVILLKMIVVDKI